MRYENQNNGRCKRCYDYRLILFWFGLALLFLVYINFKGRSTILAQKAELEFLYTKLKTKDDSLKIFIDDVKEKRLEIDLIIKRHIDSIESIHKQRKIKENEKGSISDIVSERRTLDSLAEHVVF